MDTIGNNELLLRQKTGLLCASDATSGDVMRCMDWAMELPADACIVGGFQTALERDVLHVLLRRHIPVIVVLARRLYKTIPAELQAAVDAGRALVLSVSDSPRTCRATALRRNEHVAAMADVVVFPSVPPATSSLHPLYTALAAAYKARTCSAGA